MNNSQQQERGIEAAAADYNLAAADTLLANNKVEQYSFGGLVSSFDSALSVNFTLTGWSLTNVLLDCHLATTPPRWAVNSSTSTARQAPWRASTWLPRKP